MASAHDPAPRRRARPTHDPSDVMPVATWIPFDNPPACAAYFCGLLGLIPVLGLVLGPLAIIFGIFGLRRHDRDPAVRGRGHSLVVGIWMGATEFIVNIVGLALVWKGWRELAG
jgi:hypothetical protein